jgi:prepilin-type processing-associated H-X9-DG protein
MASKLPGNVRQRIRRVGDHKNGGSRRRLDDAGNYLFVDGTVGGEEL